MVTHSLLNKSNGRIAMRQRSFDRVPHGPVTPLALVPHSGKLRLVVFDVIVNAHIRIVDVVPVQAAGILLQR
jgi:hypothetical protein